MLTFQQLRAGLESVDIVHHIRGRIRFKLDIARLAKLFQKGDFSAEQARQFHHVASRMPGVKSVKVNLMARSCTVEYDPHAIPEQSWSDFLTGVNSSAAGIVERLLHDAYLKTAEEEAAHA